jgi:hypothetical protein
MIRGHHRAGSMRGSGPSPTNSLPSTCSYRMCSSNTLALTFLPKGRKSWTTPPIWYRTLAHARWGDQFPDRSERGHAEFVRFIANSPLTFLFRHGTLAGGECEPVDMGDQIFRGQIDHTLHVRMRLSEVWPRPSIQLQPSHRADDIDATFGEPSALKVLISATGSEIEDSRLDRLVCKDDIGLARPVLSASRGQNKRCSACCQRV